MELPAGGALVSVDDEATEVRAFAGEGVTVTVRGTERVRVARVAVNDVGLPTLGDFRDIPCRREIAEAGQARDRQAFDAERATMPNVGK